MADNNASEPRVHESIALVDMGCVFAQNWFGSGENYAHTLDYTMTDLERIARSVAHMVVCLDTPPYFRKKEFPGYKASRPPSPQAMLACKRAVLDRCIERGYRLARAEGYEADDIIAGLAAIYRLVCDDVRLVGADKDLVQLVNGKVRIFRPSRGDEAEVLIDGPAAFAKYGVSPSQMVDYLALQGDKSDDVPGCPGVGKKTAADIIAAFGSIQSLYARLDSEPASVQQTLGKSVTWKLREHKDAVLRARSLVALRLDAPVDANDLLLPGAPSRPEPERGEPVPAADGGEAFDQALESFEPEPESGEQTSQAEVERAVAAETTVAGRVAATLPAYPNPSGKPEAELLDPAKAISAAAPGTKPVTQAEVERAVAAAHAVAGTEAKAHVAEVVGNDIGPQGEVKHNIVRESSTSTALTHKHTPGWDVALEPKGMAQAKWVAETLAPMFPKLGGWQGCLAIIMCGRELGLGVMASLMNFDLVEDRPSPRWQVIVAFAIQHPECEYFRLVESTDTYATFVTKRRGQPEAPPMTFSVEQAKKAGLWKPRGGWDKFPAALCRKMAAVHLARAVYPDSKASGLYCPEELAA